MLMLTVFRNMTRLQIPVASFVALIAVFGLLLLVFCALTTEVDGEEFRALGREPLFAFIRGAGVVT